MQSPNFMNVYMVLQRFFVIRLILYKFLFPCYVLVYTCTDIPIDSQTHTQSKYQYVYMHTKCMVHARLFAL